MKLLKPLNMFLDLPEELQRQIYSYDPTYKELYEECVYELKVCAYQCKIGWYREEPEEKNPDSDFTFERYKRVREWMTNFNRDYLSPPFWGIE